MGLLYLKIDYFQNPQDIFRNCSDENFFKWLFLPTSVKSVAATKEKNTVHLFTFL